MKIFYIYTVYTVFCEWVHWWRVRCVFNMKFLPHLVHFKGFSPVWLFWWHASSESKIKLSVHVLGLWGFSSLWVLWWEINSEVERSLNTQDTLRVWILRRKAKFPSNCYSVQIVLVASPAQGYEGCPKHFLPGLHGCWAADPCFSSGKARFVFWLTYLSLAFVAVWVFWCCDSPWSLMNPLPHMPHLWLFSFGWAFLCWDRREGWRKLPPHCAHLYGFSPVWIILWALRLDLWLKIFPQSSHLHFFFPACVFWCKMRYELWL